MDHTHDNKPEHPIPTPPPGDAVDALADLDPAEAPVAAERYAAELAAELEENGAAAPDPVQLRADLGDGPDA